MPLTTAPPDTANVAAQAAESSGPGSTAPESTCKASVKSWGGPAGTVHAVRGIDISVAPSETVALLGPNGAGKSTTIDVLLELTRPDAGRVTLFGGPPRAAVQAGSAHTAGAKAAVPGHNSRLAAPI